MDEKLIVREFPEEWQELEILPLTDLHIGDEKTDIRLFNKFIEYVKEKENRFVIIAGDLMNNAIKSSVSNVYNETMNPNEQKKWLIRELRPIKDRILCIVPGNHENRSSKETDCYPLEDVAIALYGDETDKIYRHDGAFLKVAFGKNTSLNRKRLAYTIGVIHGAGGGGKSGGSVNRIEDYAYSIDGLDILVMGHVHKKIGTRPSKLVIDSHNNKVTQRDFLCVIAAPWQSYGGYALRGMLRPTTRGKTRISLSGTEKYFETTI